MAGQFNIIRSMPYRRLLVLASGVALLFGMIGPLNILMMSPEKNPSWTAVLLMTFFSAATAFAMLSLFRKLYVAIPAVLLCFLGSFYTGTIEEFLTGSRTVDTAWITVRIGKEDPTEIVEVSRDQLRSLQRRRTYIGLFAVSLLGVGYALVITAITQEGKDRARLATEISLAQNIQKSLLPSGPFRNEWLEAAGITLPATEVGGDYYEVVGLSRDVVAVAIADVSGHGVGAGMLAAMTKSALRVQLDHDPSPESVLSHLNKMLYEVSDRRTFVTLAYTLFDRRRSSFSFATAGHPPALWFYNSHIQELRTPNLPLGLKPGRKFKRIWKEFGKGQSFMLFTDGVVEAANLKGEQFGDIKLREILTASTDEDVQSTISRVMHQVKRHTVGKELQDDATVLVVKV